MERDKVIELALKVDPDFQACKEDMYESLLGIEVVAAFAALVEKEALEKAAKVCDALHEDAKSEFTMANNPENREFWHGAKDQMLTASCEIRRLKDNP